MNRACCQILLLLLTVLAWPCLAAEPATPKVVHGLIDLRAPTLLDEKFPALDGEWEFYWDQLLEPADFAAGREPAGKRFMQVPAGWSSAGLPGRGHATYRLRMLPGPGKMDLGIRLVGVSSAFKIWANGELLLENGVVGRSAASETPFPSLRIPRFSSTGEPVEIVIQVSNHHERVGGIIEPVRIGAARMLEVRQVARWSLVLVVIGSLLLMGVYHLVLYGSRRSDPTTLYFGLYCLLWACNGFCSSASDWVIRMFFLWSSAHLLYAVEMLCFFISIPVGYAFFHSLYPQEFSQRLQRLAWWVGSLFAGLAVLMPLDLLSRIVPLYYFFAMGVMAFACYGLWRAVRARRAGALLIAWGFLVLGLAGLNDMLNDLQLIRSTWLILPGMFVFVLAQSFALARRFSTAFAAVEKLTGTLEERNQELQEEMAERTRLEREIVQVSEEERRSISRDLHDGLCQQLTAARLRCSVLENKQAAAGEPSGELAQLSALLEQSVDHAYELSRGLWPVEHDARSLVSSLEELANRFCSGNGVDIEFSRELACADCRNENAGQIYHIAKEALFNALKHARAKLIRVSLDCRTHPSCLVMRIEDDGVGRQAASPSRGGLGIRIMHHRARMIGGELDVTDRSGSGTVVQCTVPCTECLRQVLQAERNAT